jgi:ANTAR domain
MLEAGQDRGHAAAAARREALRSRGERAQQTAQILRARAQGLKEELGEAGKACQSELLIVSPLARLRAQLATMPVIEQAKGIMMAQQGCGAEEAFDLLRRASQRSNVPVRELAKLIVSNTQSRAGQAWTEHSLLCELPEYPPRGVSTCFRRFWAGDKPLRLRGLRGQFSFLASGAMGALRW